MNYSTPTKPQHWQDHLNHIKPDQQRVTCVKTKATFAVHYSRVLLGSQLLWSLSFLPCFLGLQKQTHIQTLPSLAALLKTAGSRQIWLPSGQQKHFFSAPSSPFWRGICNAFSSGPAAVSGQPLRTRKQLRRCLPRRIWPLHGWRLKQKLMDVSEEWKSTQQPKQGRALL